jgi:hypothetical protein
MTVVPNEQVQSTTSAVSEEQTPQRHRSIFHWHRSTLVILLCVIACLTLIEVPGQTSNTYYFRDFYVQEHGWPFVHLKRCVQRPATTC